MHTLAKFANSTSSAGGEGTKCLETESYVLGVMPLEIEYIIDQLQIGQFPGSSPLDEKRNRNHRELWF
jgi:hypothetical protein